MNQQSTSFGKVFCWRQTCISWWGLEQFVHRQLHKRQTWCSERDPMRSCPPPPPPWWGPPPNLKQAGTSGNCRFWQSVHIWPFLPAVRWCLFSHPGGDQAATAFPFGELRHAQRQGCVCTNLYISYPWAKCWQQKYLSILQFSAEHHPANCSFKDRCAKSVYDHDPPGETRTPNLPRHHFRPLPLDLPLLSSPSL